MDLPVSLDRRQHARGTLVGARRRFPRLGLTLDAFYESESCTVLSSRIELSLRGAYLMTRAADAEDTCGVLRLDLGEGPMLRIDVAVSRCVDGRRGGMALRFVNLGETERLRLAAFLVRRGGLAVIPALENRFAGWTHLAHPKLRRELRGHARRTA